MFQDDGNGCLTHLRFPQKLWYLLNARTDAIIWGTSGRTILLNYNVLDRYLRCKKSIFKTTHISSFIRQLNLYGFRKVTSHLQDPLCNSSNPDLHEYMHDFFQYGKSELLNNIKRKTWNMKKFNTVYKHTNLKINRTFGSQRLRKARKALQEALHRATIQYDRMPGDLKDNHETEDIIRNKHNENLDGASLPPSWISKTPQISSHYHSILPNDNHGEEMSLSTYIENFRVPDDVNAPIIEEIFGVTTTDIPMENDVCLIGEQPQLIDYKSFLNNNMVVLEVLDHNDSNRNVMQSTSHCEWSQVSDDITFAENEIFFDQTDDAIKMEENPLPDQEYGDVCGKDREEPCAEPFGEPWEYKEILKDIITKKSFPEQEYGTDLKELYTQISKTIDLLNS